MAIMVKQHEVVLVEISEAKKQRRTRTGYRPLDYCDDVCTCQCGDIPSLVSYDTATGAPNYLCDICYHLMYDKLLVPVSSHDRKEILRLLEDWVLWLQEYVAEIIKRASIAGTYPTTIHETAGGPYVFSYEYMIKLQVIQHDLCKFIPHLKTYILANTYIDGEWPIADYLELYVEYYRILVDKIYRLIRNRSED
jgi:hypothetical protein